MTLTLSDLSEWRRAEMDTPAMIIPPPQAEIKSLLDQLLKDAGPDPLALGEDCELFAAKDLLADIFRIRRNKLARACELNPDNASLPELRSLLPFENETWFYLTEGYRRLDYAISDVVKRGEWSGKWRPDKK